MSQFTKIVRVVSLAALLLMPALAIAQENGGRGPGNGPPSGDRPRRDEAGRRREGGGPGRENGGPRRNRDRNGDTGKSDDRESPRPAADAKPATSSTSTMGEKSDAEKADEYATTTIKKYDKNGDGMIQESEQEGMGSMTKKADTNGDHVITKNELVATSLGKTSPAASTPAASSASAPAPSAVVTNPGSNTSSESDATSHASDAKSKPASKTRKSYRFKSAKDRLPSGLPSSFTSKDANGDGQVSMNEYAKTWNDRTAAEFQKYDLDNDGVISADEAKSMK